MSCPHLGRTALALSLALCACGEDTGLLRVSLATAPGSTLLDNAQTLRFVITNPRQQRVAERTNSGFALDLELEASSLARSLVIDAFDAAGNLIASGASPRFALSGVDGHVAVYMAVPNSIDAAPTVLEPPRSSLAAAQLAYGAIMVGGTLASGAPSNAVAIYNAYDHTLIAAQPLPSPRSGPAVGFGTLGVYIYGGLDDTGNATSTLWRFDPSTVPSGTYFDFGSQPEFARANQQLVPLGSDRFLLTGTPGVQLLGGDGSMAAVENVAALPVAGVTVLANDGVATTIFAGDIGVVRCRGATCAMLELPARPGAAVVALPGGKVGVVCGSSNDLLRLDAATGTAETIAGIPAVPRTDCAATTTSRHLVIAGGTTAMGLANDAEILDATTLLPIATPPLLVPRTGAVATALQNDQVLISAGVDASAAPIATLELFTPDNPAE